MKYNEATIKIIIEALQEGRGRVEAVKEAKIHYCTFIDWYENKPEFTERIKRAEFIGYDRVKHKQIDKIINDKSWTSAAWWLERKYPDEFAKHEQPKDVTIEKKTIIFTTENEVNEITI
jgi:hypothetical protein